MGPASCVMDTYERIQMKITQKNLNKENFSLLKSHSFFSLCRPPFQQYYFEHPSELYDIQGKLVSYLFNFNERSTLSEISHWIHWICQWRPPLHTMWTIHRVSLGICRGAAISRIEEAILPRCWGR